MITIEVALKHYRERIRAYPIDRYPEAWAVHYNGPKHLGGMGCEIPEEGPAKALFQLMLPFGYSYEVTSSLMLFEGYTGQIDTALLDGERYLYATRLHDDGNGIWTTHWKIPYAVGDRGTRYFAEPEMSPHWIPSINQVLDGLQNHRKTAHLSFDEALHLAVVVGDDADL